ncbi:class I SAM-dependent methyltransferase [Bacillus sp. ISL-47]|uniref:class I SAM-dependent methyltransferase n=1 Tax=Bacillus sp. ISL-47 TaxID=2819130 RepID=UPI001BE61212|nr:class I SAM-dependent methyltransferase [Bacillus sp. ISL-47]MBT2690766.1 class I SAM-dependent methyltransferase [Bacillus sp. ISL-47]MBT2709710.1 class I SAM-dependent methyltransferase [Pseudomonas sp. ISL-84]
MANKFYDELAGEYHLIFKDWDHSIDRQGEVFARLLTAEGVKNSSGILDCSCGIGTQTLGLAKRGYKISASDISSKSIERAKSEAKLRNLNIPFVQADMRALSSIFSDPFQVILSIDNALPHLLTEEECASAFSEIHSLLKPEGFFLYSIRDYDEILKTKPASTLPAQRQNTITFQLWQWHKESNIYDLKHFTMLQKEGEWTVSERVSQYRAYKRHELDELAIKAGFKRVKWLFPRATGFYQPIAIAYK